MLITYLDENEFIKKERALRKYFMRCYKYLVFKVYPTLREEGKQDGIYEIELPVDELFERVYGKIKLLFSVRKDVAVLEDLVPDEILYECYMRDLPTYKGVPYANKKHLEKIKIMEVLIK